jgi:hypothetical protein
MRVAGASQAPELPFVMPDGPLPPEVIALVEEFLPRVKRREQTFSSMP